MSGTNPRIGGAGSDREIHPLLEDGDFELLDSLVGTQDPTLARLRDLAWRLALIKVSEAYFPPKAALIDPEKHHAYAVRFKELLPVGRQRFTRCQGGQTAPGPFTPIFADTLVCAASDIFLFARPCVRAGAGVSPEVFERLAYGGQIRVSASNLPMRDPENPSVFTSHLSPEKGDDRRCVLWEGAIAPFLADARGYGVQRQVVTMRAPSPLRAGIFVSGRLDALDQAWPASLGVFLTTGTRVTVEIHYPFRDDEGLELETGLVSALYTTTAKVS